MNPRIAVHYREILAKELARRCTANPRYSLRAFARDLEVSPSRISEILNRRQGLSPRSARKLADQLQLSGSAREDFCDSAESLHSKNESHRREAKKRLASRRRSSRGNYELVDEDDFRLIADWYHFAIVQLSQLENFQGTPDWVAKKLEISIHEARTAVERLTRLNLVEIHDGKIRSQGRYLTTSDRRPSAALRQFHDQILKKALSALQTQSTLNRRDSSALIVPMARADFDEVRNAIKVFRRKLSRLVNKPGPKDALYCLSLQLFDLTDTGEPCK